MGDEGLTLYVGGDESNHGNRKDTTEIIVATFSILDSDGEIVCNSKRCGYVFANNYLSPPGKSWNFTTRSGRFSQHRSQNLTRVLPSLIAHYLEGLAGGGENIFYASVSLDGEVRKGQMGGLVKDLLEMGFYEAEVKSYIKKKKDGRRRISKGYESPSLVWLADGLSSGLFQLYKDGLNLEDHRKFIPSLIDI
jgi:hypothetical protein